MPTDTEIRIGGLPTGLTLTAVVKDRATLTTQETLATLTESDGEYVGTVTGALAGVYVFEVLLSGQPLWEGLGEIADTAGPFPVGTDLYLANRLEAIKDKTDQIGSVTFVLSGGAVASDGSMVVKAGDRHVFTITSDTEDVVPDLTGVTIRFGIKGNSGSQLLSKTTDISIEQATGFQAVEVTLNPAETILLTQGSYHFDVQAEYSTTDVRTFVTGSVQVKSDYSGVAGS